MIGIKIYNKPQNIPATLDQWQELAIDTVFIGPKLRDEESFIGRLKERGIVVFVLFPVFYDPARLKTHPHEYAITTNGHKANQEWVKFACPSSKQFLVHKLTELENVMKTVQPNGISLDFMRFFVFWEKVWRENSQNLIQTCFDERCLRRFTADTGIVVPTKLNSVPVKAHWIIHEQLPSWTTWKCAVITDVVKQLSARIRAVDTSVSIGLHTLPWLVDEYGGAQHAVAGQNLTQLAPFVDFFTPMCYSHMLKEKPDWVGKIVQGQTTNSGKSVVPSIQVAKSYRSTAFPAADFATALYAGLQKPPAGILFWSWKSLDKSAAKKEIVKKALSTL